MNRIEQGIVFGVFMAAIVIVAVFQLTGHTPPWLTCLSGKMPCP